MARIPNMAKVRAIDQSEEQYELRRITTYYKPDRFGIDISEEKGKVNLVNYVEKLVRSSFEYKEMIKFLREKIDMNRCSYFKGVNNHLKGVTIEIHHAPFTLYDISYIVIDYFLENDMELNPFSIAEYVMFLHYCGMVGLFPVCKTVHELIHCGQIFVPVTHVYGDVSRFYIEYSRFMTSSQKEALLKNIKVSEKLANTPPEILQKKFIYLDVEGFHLPSPVKKRKKK